MAENFDAEALVLMILAYITLIILILRIALALCQFTIKNEIDRTKRMRERSLPLEKVTVIKADENKQNSNKHKNYKRPIKNHNSTDYSTDYEQHRTVSSDSSKENKNIHPTAKKVKDDSFWKHSFEESELSQENSTIPHTSAYGMRKVGKKKYIDDTNIGSPESKALEQKSSEQVEVQKRNNDAIEDNANEHVNQSNTK